MTPAEPASSTPLAPSRAPATPETLANPTSGTAPETLANPTSDTSQESTRLAGPALVEGAVRGACSGVPLAFLLAAAAAPGFALLERLLTTTAALGFAATLGAGDSLSATFRGSGARAAVRFASGFMAPVVACLPLFSGPRIATNLRTEATTVAIVTFVAALGAGCGTALAGSAAGEGHRRFFLRRWAAAITATLVLVLGFVANVALTTPAEHLPPLLGVGLTCLVAGSLVATVVCVLLVLGDVAGLPLSRLVGKKLAPQDDA